MPNFAFRFLAKRVPESERNRFSLSSLRLVTNCAEPIDAESIDAFQRAFAEAGLKPGVVSSSYAMAENVFAVTQTRVDCGTGPRRVWVDGEALRLHHSVRPVESSERSARCLVSSGQCLSNNAVKIVDASVHALPDGEVGEIAIASDSLFSSYLHQPELTQRARNGEWFLTGDLGFVYERELFVVGRKKDLIIIAGRNIYPHDVEDIVARHDAIHDGRCVAFGLFDTEQGTEALFAVAETEDDSYLPQAHHVSMEVSQWLHLELNTALKRLFLKPRGWLVKSTSGKPARTATRDKLLLEHPELAQSPVFRRGITS